MATELEPRWEYRTAPAGPIDVAVVNDEMGARTLQKIMLTRFYDRVTAHTMRDAQQFLTFSQRHSIDLVLLDDMLPGMSGDELLVRLRGDFQWNHVPIIMVTCRHHNLQLARFYAAGADSVLSFPVSLEQFAARLDPYMNRTARITRR